MFCVCPLEERIVNKLCFPSDFTMQTVFTSISRPDKLAQLLKIYCKPLAKKLKFSTFVAKSDLRFEVY